MKKYILIVLFVMSISCVYSQTNTDKLKSAFGSEKTSKNAIAYMKVLDEGANNASEICRVMDSLFTLYPLDKFSDDTWYFFDRYVDDLRSPLMTKILLDKYWANRLWGSERVNNKLAKLSMKMIEEIFSPNSSKWDDEFLEKHLLLLNSFDLLESEHLGLCAFLLKLKLDGNYAYAISVLQFAIPHYIPGEWTLTLKKIMINCANLDADPAVNIPRVKEYLSRTAQEHYVAGGKYRTMADAIIL